MHVHRVSSSALLLLAAVIGLAGCVPVDAADAAGAAPIFDDSFWKRWGDGKAEVSGYRLTYPRYGAERPGTAVTIFVTETFADDVRVKHERGVRSKDATYPVMKLNLVQDFPTGVYDYNLMTSSFIALQGIHGRPAGAPTKVSFSSQEWCGHVYAQLLFDAAGIRMTSHSYFDGEADQAATLDYPAEGLTEDALLLWARGFAGPVLEPGGAAEVPLLRSLENGRLRHRPIDWAAVRLERRPGTTSLTVPAGTFEVEVLTARPTRSDAPGGWTFWVEDAEERRLIKWQDPQGATAELLAGDRMPYWALNGPDGLRALESLGLKPRPAATP